MCGMVSTVCVFVCVLMVQVMCLCLFVSLGVSVSVCLCVTQTGVDGAVGLSVSHRRALCCAELVGREVLVLEAASSTIQLNTDSSRVVREHHSAIDRFVVVLQCVIVRQLLAMAYRAHRVYR